MGKVMVLIRIDESVKDKLKELAERESRTVTSFIINATNHYVKEKFNLDLTQLKNTRKNKKPKK